MAGRAFLPLMAAAAASLSLAGCKQSPTPTPQPTASAKPSASAPAVPQADGRESQGSEVVPTRFGRVRVEEFSVAEPSHADSGSLDITYLDAKPPKTFAKAVEVGSFGEMEGWRVDNGYGDLPVVVSEGGGTWQGQTCSWTVLTELRPGQVDPFDYPVVGPRMEELVLLQRSDAALRRSEHKRWQMGVVLKVSRTAFGSGRMVPITRR